MTSTLTLPDLKLNAKYEVRYVPRKDSEAVIRGTFKGAYSGHRPGLVFHVAGEVRTIPLTYLLSTRAIRERGAK